jgi:hypothetical protein
MKCMTVRELRRALKGMDQDKPAVIVLMRDDKKRKMLSMGFDGWIFQPLECSDMVQLWVSANDEYDPTSQGDGDA